MCSHVDDFCFGGTDEFNGEIMGKLNTLLKVGEVEKRSFKYIGVKINQEKENIMLDQVDYAENIRTPEEERFMGNRRLTKEELKEYRSLIGKLNWLAQHTRPDASFTVSELG